MSTIDELEVAIRARDTRIEILEAKIRALEAAVLEKQAQLDRGD